MTVLVGIDTSTDYTSVAALVGDERHAAVVIPPTPDGRPRHAESLLREVEQSVQAVGGWEAVDRIAVGIGPGSFTGLRIGIATARGLGQALGKPLCAVGSLGALAAGAAGSAAEDEPVLAVGDARRGQLSAALYRRSQECWPVELYLPAELVDRLGSLASGSLAVGDGAIKFRTLLRDAGVRIPADGDPAHRIDAGQICRLGAASAAVSPEEVEPLYLRPPDAELWRERQSH